MKISPNACCGILFMVLFIGLIVYDAKHPSTFPIEPPVQSAVTK